MRILPQDIMKLRQECPQAKVVAHPECRPGVIALADEGLSTGGMRRFAQQTEAKEIYVGTENGIIHRLRKENPGKKFIPASSRVVCPNMKLITFWQGDRSRRGCYST
jgi:quinolinate synthase